MKEKICRREKSDQGIETGSIFMSFMIDISSLGAETRSLTSMNAVSKYAYEDAHDIDYRAFDIS